MPGLFGAIGCRDPNVYARIKAEFLNVWADTHSFGGDHWLLGAHAFGKRSALFNVGTDCYAVDGQHSLYTEPSRESDPFRHDFTTTGGVVQLGPSYSGNLALVETERRVLHLAVEWTGTFPLYYARHDGGLLFSSHLRPLARVSQAAIDDLGMLEFLRNGFTFCGRTIFAGIKRMLPGQAIAYNAHDDVVKVHEMSRAWAPSPEVVPFELAPEMAWHLLEEATQRTVPAKQRVALMMSAGWDSRTLLAALAPFAKGRLTCYSHGDVASRELSIVDRLARQCGVDCTLEPIDSRVLDLHDLEIGFNRVENVVFPHWHRASRILAEIGISCVTAGVYGEIMGGHYGLPTVLSGRQKMFAVAAGLIRGPSERDLGTRSADSLLGIKPFGHHWYLSPDFQNAIPTPVDRMNADVQTDLVRLRRRDIFSRDHLIEAFLAEHRGSHYINAQLLSCRAHLDIAAPFIEQKPLGFASRLAFRSKVHNRLNQQMLRKHAPALLRFPLAATLAPANAPLLLQETSRLVRKTYESGRLALYERTGGMTGFPRLAWVNFGFLRSGILSDLVEDLRSDCWDRDALQRRLEFVATGHAASQLHPVYDQLGKVYTVDLLCR